jgi:hypothetical protein
MTKMIFLLLGLGVALLVVAVLLIMAAPKREQTMGMVQSVQCESMFGERLCTVVYAFQDDGANEVYTITERVPDRGFQAGMEVPVHYVPRQGASTATLLSPTLHVLSAMGWFVLAIALILLTSGAVLGLRRWSPAPVPPPRAVSPNNNNAATATIMRPSMLTSILAPLRRLNPLGVAVLAVLVINILVMLSVAINLAHSTGAAQKPSAPKATAAQQQQQQRSLVDLAEFDALDPEIKQYYKKLVVNQIMPRLMEMVNRQSGGASGILEVLKENEAEIGAAIDALLDNMEASSTEADALGIGRVGRDTVRRLLQAQLLGELVPTSPTQEEEEDEEEEEEP